MKNQLKTEFTTEKILTAILMVIEEQENTVTVLDESMGEEIIF